MAEDLPFARLVRDRMQERGLGLRELCRAVGLDPSFFSKVLAGKRNPPAEEEVLRRIASKLELDPPRLIVAAGRIPREWRRLWADDALFHSVHELASAVGSIRQPARAAAGRSWSRERNRPAVRTPARSWKRGESPAAVPKKDFGEELL